MDKDLIRVAEEIIVVQQCQTQQWGSRATHACGAHIAMQYSLFTCGHTVDQVYMVPEVAIGALSVSVHVSCSMHGASSHCHLQGGPMAAYYDGYHLTPSKKMGHAACGGKSFKILVDVPHSVISKLETT